MYTVTGWYEQSLDQTVVVFAAQDDETKELVTIGVDHRMAQPILADLRAAQTHADRPKVEAEDWQILSRRRMTLGDYGYNND